MKFSTGVFSGVFSRAAEKLKKHGGLNGVRLCVQVGAASLWFFPAARWGGPRRSVKRQAVLPTPVSLLRPLLRTLLVSQLRMQATAQNRTKVCLPTQPWRRHSYKPPKLIKSVAAEYPEAAKAEQIATFVDLVLDIDESGQVANVEVLEPSTHPAYGFEEAAIVAAYQLEFDPAEYEGQPLAVQIVYRSRFEFRAPTPEGAEDSAAGAIDDGAAGAVGASGTPPTTSVENFTGVIRERGTRRRLAGDDSHGFPR